MRSGVGVGLLFGVLSACSAPQTSVDVIALRGDLPAPGVHVISHRPSGERIATLDADADGRATVPVEDDSLVTVIYPHDDVATRVYTVAVAGLTDDIVIHAPPAADPRPIIGTVAIAPASLPAADGYFIQLGDAGLWAKTWPASADVDTASIGRDGRIPIVVTAFQAGHEIAYAAGEVALAGGTATFAPATWSTAVANVPVVATGIAKPNVEWTRWIDGVEFLPADVGDAGTAWDGLPIERATLRAWLGDLNTAQQIVTRQVVGAPAQLAFGPEDFLDALPRTIAIDGMPIHGWPTGSLTFTWTKRDVDADVVALSMGWLSAHTEMDVLWDVVLPTEATRFRTPAFEGELDDLSPREVDSLLFRYIDHPDLHGFAEARATGVFSLTSNEDGTIVPVPPSGELRETMTLGYAN